MMADFKRFLAASVIIISTLAQPMALAGPSGTGGGSGVRPTEQQVKDTVLEILRDPNLELGFLVDKQGNIRDPDLKAILGQMSGDANCSELRPYLPAAYGASCQQLSVDMVKSLSKVHFIEGDCHGDDGDQDAATGLSRGAPICFSLGRIKSRYSAVNLKQALIPVVMHEIAHHFGANEALARKVQKVFSSFEFRNPNATVILDNSVNGIAGAIAAIKNGPMQDTQICANLGLLVAAAGSLEQLPSEILQDQSVFVSVDHTMYDAVAMMKGYCGPMGYSYGTANVPNDLPQVTQGDRAKLDAAATVELSNMDEVRDAVQARFGSME